MAVSAARQRREARANTQHTKTGAGLERIFTITAYANVLSVDGTPMTHAEDWFGVEETIRTQLHRFAAEVAEYRRRA